jgi:hypothetical protein
LSLIPIGQLAQSSHSGCGASANEKKSPIRSVCADRASLAFTWRSCRRRSSAPGCW